MRPIHKGPAPLINGTPKEVKDYKDWRQDLLDALDNHCCYCNMTLTDSPQVEHIVPKNPQPGQLEGDLLDWENLILACGPCNRAKSNRPVGLDTHYLPHAHNTHLAFKYVVVAHPKKPNTPACIPQPSRNSAIDGAKAQATIDLCKLDVIKHQDDRATDLRWKYRYEAMVFAIDARKDWHNWGKGIGERYIIGLARMATGIGFFSIWMQVFENVPEVCRALIAAFPGTAMDCFDGDGRPILRNPPEV